MRIVIMTIICCDVQLSLPTKVIFNWTRAGTIRVGVVAILQTILGYFVSSFSWGPVGLCLREVSKAKNTL